MSLPRFTVILATAFIATGCAAVGAVIGDSVRNELVISDPGELISLVEDPRRLAIFPFTNRTGRPGLGVIAEEVLLGEIADNYIWDGAKVSEVRDALLTAGYKWFDTADAAEARRLADKVGATAYLTGSVDDYVDAADVSLSGTVQVRIVETDRLVFFAIFSSEDNSLYRDAINPRELLRRALAALFWRVATEIGPQLTTVISEKRREIRDEIAGLRGGPLHRLGDDERNRFEGATAAVETPDDPSNRFLELRRLADARSTVRELLVHARYRERLATLRAQAAR